MSSVQSILFLLADEFGWIDIDVYKMPAHHVLKRYNQIVEKYKKKQAEEKKRANLASSHRKAQMNKQKRPRKIR